MIRFPIYIILFSLLYVIHAGDFLWMHASVRTENAQPKPDVKLFVLGTAQDAGYPQAGCMKACCSNTWKTPLAHEPVASLGFSDNSNHSLWMIDATPDFKTQTQLLSQLAGYKDSIVMPRGIFLTHAHMGHYTGLMYLGRESMNSRATKVFALPRMQNFLENNGPWNQLLALKNIAIVPLKTDSIVYLSNQLHITAMEVPHRGEYSETAGYIIEGPAKRALYIPDIDKWNLWKTNIKTLLQQVDYAFLDATFYENGEVANRNMQEIPHPFVAESCALFDSLPAAERNKIYFIHLNHTNPLLNKNSKASRETEAKGFHIARKGMTFLL